MYYLVTNKCAKIQNDGKTVENESWKVPTSSSADIDCSEGFETVQIGKCKSYVELFVTLAKRFAARLVKIT